MSSRSRQLLDRIERLIESSRAEQFQILEDTGLGTVDHELAATVRGVLEATAALLEDVQERYEAEAGDAAASGDDDTAGGRLGAAEIADLAFVSHSEVASIRDALDSSQRLHQVWKVLSYADAGLARCERALVAVDAAIREHEGLAAAHRTSSFDLQDSLEIRCRYALFGQLLRRHGQPIGEALKQALREAAAAIATLREHPVYPRMRIDDRRQIRKLQKRIEAAIYDPADDPEGLRSTLWQDLGATVHLLLNVNGREELRAHDRDLVEFALDDLRSRSTPPQVVPPYLQPLLGLDAELDRLLLAGEGASADRLTDHLARLDAELASPAR